MRKGICVFCGMLAGIVYFYTPICERCLENHKEHIHVPERNYSEEFKNYYISGINSTASVSGSSLMSNWNVRNFNN